MPMKIVYVEDNPDSIHPIERIISYLGYELLVADTIECGLAKLNEQPMFVLVDMLLPDGDAIAFTKKARLQWPTLPIIILSGYANKLYDRELAKWGRHDFELPNNAAGGAVKRRMIESVWCNYKLSKR